MDHFNFNVTGERRKALVRAISEIIGEDAVYQGAPTFAYKVDGYTIGRSGEVTCPDTATHEEVMQMVIALREQGFIAVGPELDIRHDDNAFVVEISRTGFSEEAYDNLQKIIASKASLLKKAIGTDTLEIKISAEKLIFPWFTLRGLGGEADAYTRLIAALCHMAKTQQRVTAKEREITNDKFTMRLFLIRLGFVGEEYKTARKILLQNLTGNSAWKAGYAPERASNNLVSAESTAEIAGGVPYAK